MTKDEEIKDALKNLLHWAKEIRTYPVAMRQLGPIVKDRFDGAIFIAEEALK